MILLITGWFDTHDNYNGYETSKKEFVVSHGIDLETDRDVILPCEHPKSLGGKFDINLGEGVIE